MFRYIYYVIKNVAGQESNNTSRIKVMVLAEDLDQAERRLQKVIKGLDYKKIVLTRIEQQV